MAMSSIVQRPRGILLDFGGVIVSTRKRETWVQEVAAEISQLIDGALPLERIEADVRAGETAAKLVRNALARPARAPEFTHTGYILDFVAAEWPEHLRRQIAEHASHLCYLTGLHSEEREMRRGTRELLEWCRAEGIAVGIASNALSGRVHREWNRDHGLSRFFRAEVYSDEAGIRKPDARFLWRAAEAIGVPISQCWYVGDHFDRDVLCGKRAGAASAVLMPAPNAEKRPFATEVEPDLTVADPAELLSVLQSLPARGAKAAATSAATSSAPETSAPETATQVAAPTSAATISKTRTAETAESVAAARQLRRQAENAVLRVEEYLRGAFRGNMHVEYKEGVHDQVTEHDRASEKILIDALLAQCPTASIIGEEYGMIEGSGPVTFYLDPIDGTSNFVQGIAFFCASVGVAYDGEICAGAILDPMARNLFSADSEAAYLNDAVLRTPQALPAGRATLITGYPTVKDLKIDGEAALQRQAQLIQYFSSVRRVGSGALSLCHVAAGWTDSALGASVNAWDIAAGMQIVRMAGGTYQPLWYSEPEPGTADQDAPGYLAWGPGGNYPVLEQVAAQIRAAR
ncbi:inositol monophosphatase family protein [Actinobaculum suis]|uniref:inositol monophosphatase family protein n=1 Tax=Actinobaculum suis TaxID=1657 RepID=UPI0009F7428F|nr:inositol monophosphatase family protein [Actinobaculum suis]